MLTAQEVRNITFDKVMRGYRVEDVDAFMAQIADDMEAMAQDKKAVEDKLYLLAEKLEEYRTQEDALRSAIVNAQRMAEGVAQEAKTKADAVLHDATVKADGLMRDATAKAERIIEATDARSQREEKAFQKMRQEITSFRNTILELYKEHIDLLSTLPVEDEPLETLPVTPASPAAPAQTAVETPVEETPANTAPWTVDEAYLRGDAPGDGVPVEITPLEDDEDKPTQVLFEE